MLTPEREAELTSELMELLNELKKDIPRWGTDLLPECCPGCGGAWSENDPEGQVVVSPNVGEGYLERIALCENNPYTELDWDEGRENNGYPVDQRREGTCGYETTINDLVMTVTFSTCDGLLYWHYQTGDNSFTGGCCGDPHWSVQYLSLETDVKGMAGAIIDEWIEQAGAWEQEDDGGGGSPDSAWDRGDEVFGRGRQAWTGWAEDRLIP